MILYLLLPLVLAVPVSVDPDTTATFQQLCLESGFQVEEYAVTTDDGYILTLYRIPGELDEEETTSKFPLLMFHGLFGNAEALVVNGPDLSPAFVLARMGYDVWIGNSRGSSHSLDHLWLSSNSSEYWQFTWNEMSQYDLPASIDFVLDRTQYPQLAYMGHSQGSTLIIGLLSDMPEWADKVAVAVCLVPDMTQLNMTNVFGIALYDSTILQEMAAANISALTLGTQSNLEAFCAQRPGNCNELDLGQWADMIVADGANSTRLPVIVSHEPDNSSILNLIYWQQLRHRSDYNIPKFDYGEAGNLQRYGQPTPPLYDLGQIRAPLSIYYGNKDTSADPTDAYWAEDKLRNNQHMKQLRVIRYQDFGHFSFIWGTDMSFLQDADFFIKQWT